jgi:hypothetical protein
MAKKKTFWNRHKSKFIVAMIIALLLLLLLLMQCGILNPKPSPTGGHDESTPPPPTAIVDCDPLWVSADREWICTGDCSSPYESCQLVPTDEMPEHGWINPNEPPNCDCLPDTGGDCNWYDLYHGDGSIEAVCGGYCPADKDCISWVDSDSDTAYCKCLDPDDPLPPSGDECGWRQGYIRSDYCSGDCPPDEVCEVVISGNPDAPDECLCMPIVHT